MAVIFKETFLSSGYDLSGWTETVDTGCTVNEDAACPADSNTDKPPGYNFSGSQCLYCLSADDTNDTALVDRTFTGGTDVYARCYFKVDEENFNNNQGSVGLIPIANVTAGQVNCDFQILVSGGTFYIRGRGWNYGAVFSFTSAYALSLDIWYRAELKWQSQGNSADEARFRLYTLDDEINPVWEQAISASGIGTRNADYGGAGIIQGSGTDAASDTKIYIAAVEYNDSTWPGPYVPSSSSSSQSVSNSSSSSSISDSESSSSSSVSFSESSSSSSISFSESSSSSSISDSESSSSSSISDSISSSSSSVSDSESSSSSSSGVIIPPGWAFGEQNPTQNEGAESWQTWTDGAAGSPTILGNQDWGKIAFDGTGVGHSLVKDTESTLTKAITVTVDRYGTGTGTVEIYVRGSATPFNQDDASPAWELYSSTIQKAWRYIQVKAQCGL